MPLTAAERQKRYRERLKENNPIKWKAQKNKNAEKKRREYIKISELSETEKDIRRKVWRKLKQKKVDLNDEEKTSQFTSRKVYKERHYRITKENKKLKRSIDILKKKVDSLRKKVYRYKLLLACQKNDRDHGKENSEPSFPSAATSPITRTESFIRQLKDVPSPEKHKVRKVILEKNVLSESLTNSYKNAKNNVERKILKNVINNDLVQKHKLKTRFSYCVGLTGRIRISKKPITTKHNELAGVIKNYYLQDDVSRITAGKKETKTNKKVKMQKRYLLDNITNLYKKFKQETGINLSYSTFLRYKPFYVISPKLSDRDTCICKKHSNIEFKFASLKRLSALNDPKTLNELVKSLVCNLQSQRCMYAQCAVCKLRKITYDFATTSLYDNVTWLEWSIKNVEYKNDNLIKTSKRNVKEIKTGTLRDLITKFEQELQHFKIHLFNIDHQYAMYKYMKDSLKTNELLLHCDFSENYTCKMYQEIQAVHFGASQYQISLHTSVVYKKSQKPQCYCTFSNSTDHSPEAIWAHLKPILKDITQETSEIDTIHYFSDGPTTQYRQKKNFILFNKIIKDFGLTGTWNFFEAAHGKGAADGVGGLIKRLLDKKVAHGYDVLNAEEAYTLLRNETCVNLFCINENDITSIKKDNEKSLQSLIAVPNTMKIHQIQATNQSHVIASRILSCFCARSAKRGFCVCFSLKSHNLLKIMKRTKRLPSSSSSSSFGKQENEIMPQKCLPNTVKSNTTQDSHVITILSDVRVNYDQETLQTLMGSTKSCNISAIDLRKDFKDLIIPKKNFSNTDGNIYVTKVADNFFDLSDDSDENIF